MNSTLTIVQAVAELNRIMGELLVKYRGYNVPQREGHYLQTFRAPEDAVDYHVELQVTAATRIFSCFFADSYDDVLICNSEHC